LLAKNIVVNWKLILWYKNIVLQDCRWPRPKFFVCSHTGTHKIVHANHAKQNMGHISYPNASKSCTKNTRKHGYRQSDLQIEV